MPSLRLLDSRRGFHPPSLGVKAGYETRDLFFGKTTYPAACGRVAGPAIVPAASLYLHWPFCRSKCDYCDFFSRPVAGQSQPGLFAGHMEAMIAHLMCQGQTGLLAAGLDTVYVGGGTPSLMPGKQIAGLLDRIRAIAPLNPAAEVTLEANPEDITADFLAAIRDGGVNRLSLGIQSLCDDALRLVHRRAGREAGVAALDLARRAISGNGRRSVLSCDLIAGFPGETSRSFLAGLETVVRCEPQHISLYALTLTAGTPLQRRLAGDKQAPEIIDELWLRGRDFLERAGYRQYEVSNFAKPGFECRHNLAYWRGYSYAGAGAGATGSFYRTDGSCRRITIREDGTRHIEEIDRQTARFEYLMLGFRTIDGVSAQSFFRRFGMVLEDCIGPFPRWQARGLAEQRGDRYALTREGLLFLNKFLTEL